MGADGGRGARAEWASKGVRQAGASLMFTEIWRCR